jgi:predicted XRE-type DNA-binding protein
MKRATRKSSTENSGNVFIDLGFQPHEAAVMLLRCELAEALRKWIEREGITQPRISEVSRNKVHKLSLDYLVGLCAKAGIAVKVRTAA